MKAQLCNSHSPSEGGNRLASLPQIPAPLRRMQGSSYAALPVEPHSCQTHGCMWSTS